MEDPVVAKDGHTYERSAIEAYINEHHKSPISGQPLDIDGLIENRAVQDQIDSYHEAAERAGRFEEHATDGAGHPTLMRTLTEADMLAAQQLYEEAANVYEHLMRGLQAQLSVATKDGEKDALMDRIVMVKQRQAGVEANRTQSSVLAAPLVVGTGVDVSRTGSGVNLERMRSTTEDFEDSRPLSPAAQEAFPAGSPSIQELLAECVKHNFESQGEEEPVKGKSIWLKYNAGRRRGLWREVWPCNDSETPPWLPNSIGTPPYFRGMEAADIDIHHGRTTKYLLHLVLQVSTTLPPDWNDSPLQGCTSAVSAMTDEGDYAGSVGSPPAMGMMQRWEGTAPEPEPEAEVRLPQLQPATPRVELAQGSPIIGGRYSLPTPSPVAVRQRVLSAPSPDVMRGSARDLLVQHDVPDHVADMLEEEDIHTPQTLVDLDDDMVNGLGLKLGEKIKLKQAIKYARTISGMDQDVSTHPVSPNRPNDDAAETPFLLDEDIDSLSPTISATDVRYQEAYRGFQKASDISDVGEIMVEEYLSKGTSGTVCKAQWRGMSVAVKRFYYVDDDKELVGSFENEVFFMRELQHVNLIRFFAAQCKPPDLCIVMELMLGSLADLLYGKLSKGVEETLKPRRQLSIVKGIASGMHFLHDHGICHRDLKSANVLFNRHLDVKLCDFAFSKFKQQASMSARFETSVGTPAWMAPEVLRGDEYTLLADVYSFGVIVWEIVCREAPFTELNRFQIIFQVGTQGVLLEFPSGTAPIWVAVANACWREKPLTAKSRRPTFRQIVEAMTATQRQLKEGVSLSDGCGMAAWDAAEVVRESDYVQEMAALGLDAKLQLPALHEGIVEDTEGETRATDDETAQVDSTATVTPADPDAAVDIPLARASPKRALSASVIAASHPPPASPRGDNA